MNIATKTCFPLTALALALACLAPPARAADPSTALSFEGRIKPGTCKLAAGDVSRQIDLKPVELRAFDNALAAGRYDFSITANCTGSLSNVVFAFSGTRDASDPGRFANTGTAKGIALWLYSRTGNNGAAETIFPTAPTRTVAISGGKAELPMGAGYWKVGTPEKGSLESTVTVDITYN